MTAPGVIYLVGAGPGDPGLLTLKGRRCLEQADVVFYDCEVNPCLLDYAPPTALRICTENDVAAAQIDQTGLHHLLITHARAGRTVVRLAADDPLLSERGAAEAEQLAAAEIPFEIVPGVSTALGVPAYAGIPLASGGTASAVTILTGREDPGEAETAMQWAAAASRGGTLVFPVAVRQLAAAMENLIAAGVEPATPAAVIYGGSRAEQETLTGTVAIIGKFTAERRIATTALAVVGEVVRLRKGPGWYERKPLFGRRIVVTRPRRQAADFVDRLSALGADVIPCPTIEIVPPASWQPLDGAIDRLADFDWLVFTSVNGVEMFLERLRVLGRDVRLLHKLRLAAVGPQTARALEQHGLLVDVVPEEFRAEGVADAMRAAGIGNKHVLLPRAAGAREILPVMLREHGATVEEVASYQTVRARADPGELRRLLQCGAIDLVTFTSSSTVSSFLALLGSDAVGLLANTTIGCIGPITAETARAAGLTVSLQPSSYTIPAFAEAILQHFAAAARRR